MGSAYLEDYNKIKIISEFFQKNSKVIILNEEIKLTLQKKEIEGKYTHLYYQLDKQLDPHLDYQIMVDDELIDLALGKITRSANFDKVNYYDGPLGFEYHEKYTIFRIWSPVCKEVKIVFPNLNKIYDLNYLNKGLWEVKVDLELEKEAYYYLARINKNFFKTLDPYGIAGSYKEQVNYVIDINKTYQYKFSKPFFSGSLNDAIILETHLKDFTYNIEGAESSFVKAFKDTKYGLNYVKDLGITHIQFLPINMFYGIDEENKDALYNWGYNPLEYMMLTGWYASMPNDPYNKINEFKELVDTYHKHNICVNLDVVFNHVFKHDMFSYGLLVPGYCYRCDEIGFMTNGSYCGNDLATEHLMIRRLIVDTCKYLLDFYNIDGLRFDLMGLIDIETIRQIEIIASSISNQIILYGEGWQMKTGLDQSLLASNSNRLPTIGYFNDTFRNYLRGNPFQQTAAILTGNKLDKEQLYNLVMGGWNLSQSINYVECHDNYTLNDQMDKFKLTKEQKKDYLKLALGLILISQGIPFIHLGMEFGRTKKGIGNSYKDNMDINQIIWDDTIEYQDVISYLKNLINLRKTDSSFRLKTKEEVAFRMQKINNLEDYLLYILDDKEILITSTYDEYHYLDEVINKPGVYIFKNGKLI